MKSYLKLTVIILIPFIIGLTLPEKEISINEEFYYNPDYLDGPFTGGFGELTCHSCHFDYDKNLEGGRLQLEGLSSTFKSGNSYKVRITIESEHLKNGGFQLTSRFEDGTQAGDFNWDGDRLMLTPSISDDILYLQHSVTGTRPTSKTEVSWSFYWNAPTQQLNQHVIFNVAANAGNDDDSAFGDRIYTKEKKLRHSD